MTSPARDCYKIIYIILYIFPTIFSVTQSENERSCILLVQLQRRDGSTIWCHLVMQVKKKKDSNIVRETE